MSSALAFALTPREPPPSHTAQHYAVRVQDLVALARLTLDHNETLAPDPDPSRDQAALAAVRGARELLGALRELVAHPPEPWPASLLAEVEELYDRADELVDTLIWAVEGVDVLREVIEAETCASPPSLPRALVGPWRRSSTASPASSPASKPTSQPPGPN